MGNDNLSKDEIIKLIINNINIDKNRYFNATVLLFIGVVLQNIEYVQLSLDNGAKVNTPLTPEIRYILKEIGHPIE